MAARGRSGRGVQVGTQPIAGPSSRTRDRLREVSVPRPAPRLYKAADRVADQGVALLEDELMIAARMPPSIAARGRSVRRRRPGPAWRRPLLNVTLAAAE